MSEAQKDSVAKFERVRGCGIEGDDLLQCTKCNGYFIWMRSKSMISSGRDPDFCPHCGVKLER